MLLRSIQHRWLELEDSGQCLENVDRTTHLVWLVASQYYKKVISAFRRGWFRLPVAGLPLRFALPRRGDQTRQLPHLSHPAQVDRCQDRQVDWNQRLQIGNERHYCASVTSSCAELWFFKLKRNFYFVLIKPLEWTLNASDGLVKTKYCEKTALAAVKLV